MNVILLAFAVILGYSIFPTIIGIFSERYFKRKTKGPAGYSDMKPNSFEDEKEMYYEYSRTQGLFGGKRI